eukprot:5849544-Prymnesium_polylepis.1
MWRASGADTHPTPPAQVRARRVGNRFGNVGRRSYEYAHRACDIHARAAADRGICHDARDTHGCRLEHRVLRRHTAVIG